MGFKCSYSCCFTGHRANKLKTSENDIREELVLAIRQAYMDGYVCYITGCAWGVDLIAAECVLAFKKQHPEVKLICAVPYPDFGRNWSYGWKKRYREVLELADEVHHVSMSFSRDCYQCRNEWMVDHSSRLIAVYNGAKGGTKNTIDYAMRRGITIVLIDFRDR